MLKIQEQEYMPLREVVFNTLRQAIIKGELLPGQRLTELQLSEELGVSRTPVREAIRKLELEGLVVMLPRRGATVAGITKKHLMDVLDIRRALEELAIELACERITAEQLSEIKTVEKKIKESRDDDDVVALSDADETFHELIYQATDNSRLIQMLANLREQMYRYRLEYMKVKDKRNKLISEHNRILKALETGDVAAGKKAICAHIDSQEKEILNKIGE